MNYFTSTMKIFGFEFAPLFIPFERRIQTACVFQWTLSFLCMGFGSLAIFIYVLFTEYYYISLAYLIWYIYDYNTCERGGRRLEWQMNNPVWKYFSAYFPIKLIKTAELDPSKNYIVGYHPHGIMSAGAFANFATNATGFKDIFPNMHQYLCILTGQFRFPFFREYLMSSGCCSVSKTSLSWLLNQKEKGKFITIVVGGAVEATEANPGQFKLKIKNRKGFIKLALQHGTPLLPVYSFGENDLFLQLSAEKRQWLKWFQLRFTKFMGFSPVIFHGRGIFNYTFGILPFRKPVNTVVGKPIDVPLIENPSKEEVEKIHTIYLKSLYELFEEYKGRYGIDEMNHLIFQ
ncbi:2-acylglycerol O-acyltransferase 1-like [Argonauta hians]